MQTSHPSPALSDEQIQAVVGSIDGLCMLPSSVARLLELLRSDGADAARRLTDLAGADLAMTVCLLAGAPGTTTAGQAIGRTGVSAAAAALLSTPMETPAPGSLNRPAFWRHCIAVACAAKAIAVAVPPGAVAAESSGHDDTRMGATG